MTRNICAAPATPAGMGCPDLLIGAAARGDERAWALVRERYAPRIRTVARRHRLSPHDAEDVIQTTWLRLLEHIGAIRDPAALGAWLETTARRESLRLIRAARRERPTDNALIADGALAAPEVGAAPVERVALASAMERLPERHRALVAMLLREPAPSYAAVARGLGMPIGSIGPTRARCLERLRRDESIAGLRAGGLD